MAGCVTHKICYTTHAIALEALIQNRTRHHHGNNAGPINVYQCEDCGQYHFTSKGPVNDAIAQNKDRIEQGRQADYWERKLRK